MASTSATLQAWNKVAKLPLGTWLFSRAVCFKAPYFRTIRPHIVDLRPGLCEVRSANKRRVHNHIGTFHAIAACNMAEVAAGMLTEVSIPATHRWIPVGMSVDYVAKATTDLRAIASVDPLPEFGDDRQEWTIPVEILDTNDTAVVTARITVYVSPKPAQLSKAA